MQITKLSKGVLFVCGFYYSLLKVKKLRREKMNLSQFFNASTESPVETNTEVVLTSKFINFKIY